eukprot:SAG25_NODE_557_length_6935_cov_25.929930_4_plen_451_part_00
MMETGAQGFPPKNGPPVFQAAEDKAPGLQPASVQQHGASAPKTLTAGAAGATGAASIQLMQYDPGHHHGDGKPVLDADAAEQAVAPTGRQNDNQGGPPLRDDDARPLIRQLQRHGPPAGPVTTLAPASPALLPSLGAPEAASESQQTANEASLALLEETVSSRASDSADSAEPDDDNNDSFISTQENTFGEQDEEFVPDSTFASSSTSTTSSIPATSLADSCEITTPTTNTGELTMDTKEETPQQGQPAPQPVQPRWVPVHTHTFARKSAGGLVPRKKLADFEGRKGPDDLSGIPDWEEEELGSTDEDVNPPEEIADLRFRLEQSEQKLAIAERDFRRSQEGAKARDADANILATHATEQISHLQQVVDDQSTSLKKAAQDYKEVQEELEECQEELTLVTARWEAEIFLQLRTQDELVKAYGRRAAIERDLLLRLFEPSKKRKLDNSASN